MSGERLTKAQREELEILKSCKHGGKFFDRLYAYPARHFHALERAGLVTITSAALNEGFVQLTKRGWSFASRPSNEGDDRG